MMNAPIKPQTLVPFVALSLLVAGGETLAQSIVPASDGTGTIVNIDGNEFVIDGGTLSGDGANLFHSFIELGLDANQIATFLSNPQIQNILGRVTGGNPSVIDGLIQVLGGDSNLYLMNPSGFVFGSNATLNVPGDFFVTTAQGIGFGNGLWFDVWGDNDYQSLVGTPVEFDLSDRSGTIINAGDLTVSEGQNIGLIGGSVINTGSLSAPEGNVSIVAMPESGRLRIVSGNNVLGFEIEPPRDRQGNPVAVRGVDIPALITGSGVETGLTVEGNAVRIDNSELLVETGDVVSRNIIADNAILSAANNLTLPESQIATTNHLTLLAGDTVRIRDSENQPFLARAGGDFYIQGDRNIDILALNHLVTPLVSDGNLTLVSDGNISGDAHFSSGGNFSMLNLSGDAGNFVSLYDPIIRANGDIEFGNYTGVALKIEATGSIQGGKIQITGADISGSIPLSDPDYTTLTTSQSVILRAGLASTNPINFPGTEGGTDFKSPGTPLLPSGSIQVDSIYTNSYTDNVDGGSVELQATGNIVTDGIYTFFLQRSGSGNGGSVNLNADGIITTGEIETYSGTASGNGNGGDVILNALKDITTENINSDGGIITVISHQGSINAKDMSSSIVSNTLDPVGSITLEARESINVAALMMSGSGDGVIQVKSHNGDITVSNRFVASIISGGSSLISVDAGRDIMISSSIVTSAQDNSETGKIHLISRGGNIELDSLQTFSARNAGSIILETTGNITTGNINSRSLNNNGGNVIIIAPNGITTGGIDSSAKQDGGYIYLESSNDGIDTSAGVVNAAGGNNGGDITLDAAGDITTAGVGEQGILVISGFNENSGNLRLESDGNIDTSAGPLITASANGTGGGITINAAGDVMTDRINAQSFSTTGGSIDIKAGTTVTVSGDIETNQNNITFDAPVFLADDLAVRIFDNGDINFKNTVDGTQNLNLDPGMGNVRLEDAVGESIALNSINIQGNIPTSPTPIDITTHQNIIARDIISETGISLTSNQGEIHTGILDTSSTNNAGDITLNAPNDITVRHINAQSEQATGGNVDITTPRYFRATETFTDKNNTDASISTAGNTDGGTTIIRHGGNGQIPFIVGDSTINGTEGDITRGNDDPVRSIETRQEYLYTYKQDSDRLQIISVPPPQNPNQPQPTPQPIPQLQPTPQPSELDELERGDNPIEDLAYLIGDLINAETKIETDSSGDYSFEWQVPNPNSNEQVLLALDVENPYATETPTPQNLTNSADASLSTLNEISPLNINANPEQIVTDIEQLLETEYETYFGDNLTDEKVTAESIRDTLKTIEIETGTRAVVVYALPYPEALQLVLVRPEDQPLVTTVADVDSRTLELRLSQFRNALVTPSNNSYQVHAQKLYQWLIAPIESELEELDIDTLIFSMGAGLRSLPLAALHNGEQFLVEKYSLGTIPSVALTDTSYQSVREARILGMGAEEFHSFSNQPDLPSVPLELAAIVDRPAKGETFLNEEFTLANLRHQRNQSRYDIVHLATHASFEPKNDQNTYIQFWQEKIRLDALREARWYDYAAVELLVLSACKTALGDRRSEMGFAGLAVRSGVKSALASLWKINDFVTLPAIAEFYNQLAREDVTIKAEALRQSQIALLSGRVRVESGQIVGLSQPIPLPPELHHWEGRDLSHPYFWAGYTAIGSPW